MTHSETNSETKHGSMLRRKVSATLRSAVAVAAALGVLGGMGCGFTPTPVDPAAVEDWVTEEEPGGAADADESPGNLDLKVVDGHGSAEGLAVVETKRELVGPPLAAPANSMAVIKTEAAERLSVPAQGVTPPGPPAPPPPPVPPGPAVLGIDVNGLDFGSGKNARVFAVSNRGGGSVAYTIETSTSWAVVDSDNGSVTTETDTITVTVDRALLYTGTHTAQVTVRGDDGSVRVLPVTLVKPNTFPLTVPWLELGLATPEDLQLARDGLVDWRRVTDTVCLLAGPNETYAYTTIQAEFPGMTIIPSIKSSPRTTPRSLDSIEAWQLMAADIAVVCAATGVNQVVLENETAMWNYLHGTAPIDLAQFRQALSYLPTNVEIIWYPGVSVSTDAALVARSVALCQAVEDVLHPRFVDLSFGDPDWPYYPPSWYARETMDNMAQQTTMPIVYLGYQDWQYWSYQNAPVALGQIDPRPSCLFYPGRTQWVAAAQAVADRFWPVAVQQQDGDGGDAPELTVDEDVPD